MKNKKEKIMKKEKVYNLLVFILIFITLLCIVLIRPIENLDEIWHYNFARNIAEGLIPYKDFNIVVTPLLAFICAFVLKLTFYELIIMRILGALLGTVILYVAYKIFNILNIKKSFSVLCTFAFGYILKDIFCVDYNQANLLIALIIIYKEIKWYKKDFIFIKCNFREDFFLGILGGLAITTKHTIGLFICMALLGNRLLFVKKKEELIIYLRSFLYRFIGIIISVITFIIYLFANNAFDEFISYTIGGIKEFTNVIPYTSLININFVGLFSVLVPITFIYSWIKSVILDKDKMMYLMMVYGLATFAIAFPISSQGHFLVGALPTIILILYELYKFFLLKIIGQDKKSREICNLILKQLMFWIILLCIVSSIGNIILYLKNKDNLSNLNHFKYIFIAESLQREIQNISNYIIAEENVKILDTTAAMFMVPIDKYNKDYDMFNKGNFGANGEQRIIQEISNTANIKYLILNDRYQKNWQIPQNIIDYVKNNKNKVGEIEYFDIYE